MHPWRLSAFLTPKERSGSILDFMILPSLKSPEPSRMVKDAGSWLRPATDHVHKKLNRRNLDLLLGFFFSSLRLTSLQGGKRLSLCLLLAL